MASNTLTITDNRTEKTYEVPIADGTIRATDLRKIKVSGDDFGLMTYDPAFMNTASCRSSITFIDGDKGILEYRGYPIEQLAEKSTYLETAFLLLNGHLPSKDELQLAHTSGARFRKLGPRRLRAETAAIVAITRLLTESGEMD